jgi:hypothetical protein
MKLLILTQYFPPEVGATQARLSELATKLHQRGHDITVLTAMPNYPTGRVFDGYRRRCAWRRNSMTCASSAPGSGRQSLNGNCPD